MKDAIRAYLPWLLSAITIWMTVLAGNRHKSAWLIGLVNQFLWLVWIAIVGAWGLLPMNLALWIVYGRNHLRWNQMEDTIYVGNHEPQREVTVQTSRDRSLGLDPGTSDGTRKS